VRFTIQVWKVLQLVELYDQEKLNLNPPYQRNPIWTEPAQKLLIDTIKKGLPLPTFFLQESDSGYTMVDGQQRTRALLAFKKGDFLDDSGEAFQEERFKRYEIAVVLLDKGMNIDEVREFYVRVNRSGARLERPELNKAEFFKTRFLQVTTRLSEKVEFRELQIFKKGQIRRMFDRDFVEELSALIIHGPTDKKKTVDQMFRADVTPEQAITIESTFDKVMNRIAVLNAEIPLSDTRFTQKNDFYTLFSMIVEVDNLNDIELVQLYRVLVHISKGISPSNDLCPILKEYAVNCVTQSNSKKARGRRLEILRQLLLSKGEEINDPQRQVAEVFNLSKELQQIGPYRTLAL